MQRISTSYMKPKVETIFKYAVMKIKYDIDLSHLKKSKWVVR
jgi:hypothetical protein